MKIMFDVAVRVHDEYLALSYSVIADTPEQASETALEDAQRKGHLAVEANVVDSRPTDGKYECFVCEGEEGHSCKFCYGEGRIPLALCEESSEGALA